MHSLSTMIEKNKAETRTEPSNEASQSPHPGRYSSVDPGAHLPRLADVGSLAPSEQRAALSQWVSWFNGNRFLVPPELDERLNQALLLFDREQARPNKDELEHVQKDFDDWLLNLSSKA